MRLPLVSVVMPTLNASRYIREAIHSLIEQTYPRFELIVVDGGSTDDTVRIIETYLGDGDLKILELGPNVGVAKALNAGFAAAEGDFIARMDADDIAYAFRLREQVNFLIGNPTIALIGASVDNFGEYEGLVRRPRSRADILNSFLVSNPFYHSTIMIHRRLFDDGVYRYEESQDCDEDYELWGRLVPKVVCANMEQSLLRYRLHHGNGGWDPRKRVAKATALWRFCNNYGISDSLLVNALAEFQCGGLLRYEDYGELRDYAARADRQNLPKLGWIHEAILQERTYSDFSLWLASTSDWTNRRTPRSSAVPVKMEA